MPVWKQRENSEVSGGARTEAHSFSTRAGIPSGPVALEASRRDRCRRSV